MYFNSLSNCRQRSEISPYAEKVAI